MPLPPTFVAGIAVILLATTSSPASADPRDVLTACQALLSRAAQAAQFEPAQADRSNPELQRCRQVIRDWTLRESRMSVDENGKPLR